MAMWEVFRHTRSTTQLANFAIRLLGMSVNQAGLERNFSDLKIKKTQLRNRLKLPKLEKMAKVCTYLKMQNFSFSHTWYFEVGADIRAIQREAGLVENREKRQNHNKSNVSELLAVPCYADLVEEDAETSEEEPGHGKTQPGVVKSREGWRKEMKKWVEEERDQSDDDGELADIAYGRQRSKWLPRSLDLLFGGRKVTDIDEQLRKARRRQAYTQEARLMELLADEEADEERMPDDGELEGSGDDYEG